MKVLFISAATSNHTIRWVNSLVENGHEVLLLCRGDQPDEDNAIDSRVSIHYLKRGGRLGYYLNVPEAKMVYTRFNPDVVNVHYASGYGTMARLAGMRPMIISCWGSDVYEYPYANALARKTICKNLQYADVIASTSNAMADQTRRVLGDDSVDIAVTPFGVDSELFRPLDSKKQSDAFTIGIVKYLEPIYDVGLLIKAFSILTRYCSSNVRLEIYGGGPMLGELTTLARELGVADKTAFHGTIPNTEVPRVLNTFDVFVNCSIKESFGVAVVEAMSCELPVVVTDTAGFSEVVDNGVNGIVLEDRDPATMAAALQFLLDNPNVRRRLGKKAREKVLQEYVWEDNVARMEALYDSCAGLK